MSPSDADEFRKWLREGVSRSIGLKTDGEILREFTPIRPQEPPVMIAFYAIAVLLLGNKSRLVELFQTLIENPTAEFYKPFSAFRGAICALLPIPAELLPSRQQSLDWIVANFDHLQWNANLGVYELIV
jgi:hypothetical protein